MGLDDYQRGYRAAQRRAISLALWHREGALTHMKLELAQPVPEDPERSLGEESAKRLADAAWELSR